ncbi:response regulator [Candidatus Fermentibacteria bacterium]|nr:response regulator [Candidatus Fermentibacteria bacterium]
MAQEILVVDDDPDLVEAVRITLEAEGYDVTAARDGSEARTRIAQQAPALILLDVMMATDTEGFDLAYELQNSEETKEIPIVMLTAMSQSKDYVETFQYITDRPWPVDMFLEKPIAPKKLVETIRKVLAQRTRS